MKNNAFTGQTGCAIMMEAIDILEFTEVLIMKYKYTVLFGVLFGVVMFVLWSTVFSSILGMPGIGVSIALGVAFACCGCLLGYSIDKKNSKQG